MADAERLAEQLDKDEEDETKDVENPPDNASDAPEEETFDWEREDDAPARSREGGWAARGPGAFASVGRREDVSFGRRAERGVGSWERLVGISATFGGPAPSEFRRPARSVPAQASSAERTKRTRSSPSPWKR